MPASSLVRAGLPITVRVVAWSQETCAAGIAEVRRHVRSAAVLGLFDTGTTSPVLTSVDGLAIWIGSVQGQTWRESGSEYTAGDLSRSVQAASVCRCDVFNAAAAGGLDSAARQAIEQTDPRAPGSTAEGVARGASTVRDAGGSLLEGVGDTARGLGDAAQGIGGGAAAAGALAADWPVLAFAALVVIVVAVRRGVL